MTLTLAEALPAPGTAIRVLYPTGHPTHLVLRREEDDGRRVERVIQIAHATAISHDPRPAIPATVTSTVVLDGRTLPPAPRGPSPLDVATALTGRRPA